MDPLLANAIIVFLAAYYVKRAVVNHINHMAVSMAVPMDKEIAELKDLIEYHGISRR